MKTHPGIVILLAICGAAVIVFGGLAFALFVVIKTL